MITRKILNTTVTAIMLLSASFTYAENSTKTPPLFEKFVGQNVIKFSDNEDLKLLYFFNINCGSCRQFQPIYRNWRSSNQNAKVSYIDIPFAPSGRWQWANLAYYAIHQQDVNISPEDLAFSKFNFNKNVVNIETATEFINTVKKTKRSGIPEELMSLKTLRANEKGSKIAHAFNIKGTPSLVLVSKNGDAYKISPEFSKTFNGMLNITEALISYQSKKND